MRRNVASWFLLGLLLTALGSVSLFADTGGGNHQVFIRPAPCGISGGNILDRSKAFCCGGTLGALVTDGTDQFILSNNHVLARGNKASPGDDIIQPGLIDQSPVCFQDTSDAVADLSAFVPINFRKGTTNSVDAAIAQVRPGQVDSSGTILDIGQIAAGSGISSALLMPVAKSGRTTGYTQGTVLSVNVTLDVRYSGRCGGTNGTARFLGQIRIASDGSTPGPFSAGGDSGSLIAQRATSCPRAVGLLFAGGSTDTFANPIANVLGSFGVSMVGASCPAVTSSQSESTSTSSATSQVSGRQIAAIALASEAKERHSAVLFAIPGVIGHGVGASETDPDAAVIEIYLESANEQARRAIPAALEGIPVRVVVTGPVVAF